MKRRVRADEDDMNVVLGSQLVQLLLVKHGNETSATFRDVRIRHFTTYLPIFQSEKPTQALLGCAPVRISFPERQSRITRRSNV